MSDLKTIRHSQNAHIRRLRRAAFCALICAFTLPTQAHAVEGIAKDFAYCSGRLSAQMEHEWLMASPNSDQTKHYRDTMVMLMNASIRPEQRRHALHLRISAKMAHASLLTLIDFSSDSFKSSQAKERAEQEMGACLSLLLS